MVVVVVVVVVVEWTGEDRFIVLKMQQVRGTGG